MDDTSAKTFDYSTPTNRGQQHYMAIQLYFPVEPKAVQSFRFTRSGHRFQPKATADWKTSIRWMATEQLQPGFKPLDGALSLNVEFRFTAPKSMKKAQQKAISAGALVYKTTRPDLADNLHKGLCDSLTGVLWGDDSQIASVSSVKVFAAQAGIYVTVEQLDSCTIPGGATIERQPDDLF